MKRSHRRGFFIIWGSRNRISADGAGSIQAICPACKRPTRIDGMKVQNWFTLYFIPIFPTGSAERFTQCASCRSQFRLNLQEMQQALGRPQPTMGRPGQPILAGARPALNAGTAGALGAGGYQDAISLFNAMRDTPADSEKLGRLLHMYLEMNEPGEAISAGRAYPQAMEKSDVCLTLMAQAFLASGDRDSAARHAAAAVTLNPRNQTASRIQGQALGLG